MFLLQLVQSIKFEHSIYEKIEDSPLVKLILTRSVTNQLLRNHLYWFLLIECETIAFEKVYAKVIYLLMKRLGDYSNGGAEAIEMFKRQGEFVAELVKISNVVCDQRENRRTKV